MMHCNNSIFYRMNTCFHDAEFEISNIKTYRTIFEPGLRHLVTSGTRTAAG